MACLSTTKRNLILAKIEKKELQLASLEDALEQASTGISEYRFDSGEGSQKTVRHKPNEILDAIDRIESQIDSLYRKLNNTGLTNLNLRRKQIYYRGGGYR